MAKKQIRVVAGLIVENGKLLACQRREDGAFGLKWEFPGGKVENGESDLDALVRELREELAIGVVIADEVFAHQHDYREGPTVSLVFFHVRQYDGIVSNRVFRSLRWVDRAELDDLDFLDGDRPLLARLTENFDVLR